MTEKKSLNSIAPETVKTRYFAKLMGNGLSSVFGALQQFILSRFLGPQSYGQLIFSSNHFQSLLSGLDSGSSPAYLTYVSSDQKKYPAFTVLLLILSALLFFVLACYLFIIPSVGLEAKIWPETSVHVMVIGFFLAFSTYLSNKSIIIFDAIGINKKIEFFKVARAIIAALLLLALILFNHLNLINAMMSLALTYFCFACFAFVRGHKLMKMPLDFGVSSLKEAALLLYRYCQPLIIMSIIGVGFLIFDRWLLQLAGGAQQQAYFGIAFQLSNLVFIFTSALTSIFHREMAVSISSKTIEESKFLFVKNTKMMFSLTAIISLFFVINAKDILQVTSGEKYLEGALTLSIYFFYPIHQTYGQLSSTTLLAMGATKSYMYVNLFSSLLGFILGYLLLSPSTWIIPGLNLGALGLAIKMVVIQFISTSLQNFFCAQSFKFSFLKFLASDMRIIACLLGAALLATQPGLYFLKGIGEWPSILRLLLSFAVYSGEVFLCIYFFPTLLKIPKLRTLVH